MNQHAKRRHAQSQSRAADERPSAPPQTRVARRPAPPPSALELAGGAVRFVVEADSASERLDKFLPARLASAGELLSRTRVKALIEDGAATIDGTIVVDPAARTQPGQTIELTVPPAMPAAPEAQAIPLTVVFEDAHLIVIDKPAGLVVHPAAGHQSGTLVNALIAHCGPSLSGIGGVRRPGIVHRLDKDTSGLIVVAKTDAAHRGLAALFADHGRNLGLAREYEALVWDVPDRMAGVVDAPLGRHPQTRDRQAVVRAGGRDAITHWRLEAAYPDEAGRPIAARVRCRLETGRTHQIRVHMASIGHPLMADPLYAAGFKTKSARLNASAQGALAALGRQALHAVLLGFPHPITGEELRFVSPPPPDMANLISALDHAAIGRNRPIAANVIDS